MFARSTQPYHWHVVVSKKLQSQSPMQLSSENDQMQREMFGHMSTLFKEQFCIGKNSWFEKETFYFCPEIKIGSLNN
jgi:hypothetical protein